MRYRIALVEYLNTLPFSEGFRLTGFERKHEVHRVTPSRCAELFQRGVVDISLCPVGALEDMPPYERVGRYCIGADGEVRTVMLLSKVPLEEIRSVRLDDHSRTSNVLLKILADRYWNANWIYYLAGENGQTESCLMIGDKVFLYKDSYPYQYDLAAAWKSLTGLPMVFAVWIATPGIPGDIISELDEAFRQGMESILRQPSGLENWQTEYLTQNISYPFDARKKEALALYRNWVETLLKEQVEVKHIPS